VEPSAGGDIAKTSKPREKKGVGSIKAPLPGTILEVKVKPGDKVKVGDKLLIMEAMKMENNINSDREGTIEAIKIRAGDSVLEGDLLVEIGE
jgi:biotin carboxyl carrier protein